ncbi:MAG: sugar ABC transporter permease, partial [Chitinivibrionia bacterium]|nr:sugar ABC transporter permease [Chitinivibrionia bacterium]
LLPWAVVYGAFYIFPFVFSFVLAFLSYNPLNVQGAAFIGLDNFERLFHDRIFLQALKNTVIFVVGTVPITTAFALLLALLLGGRIPGRGFFKAGFFLPSLISTVVIALLFKLFYSPGGALNAMLAPLGISGKAWLMDPGTALPAVMLMDIWAATGYYAVIFYAACEAIPKELYEAAALEGAGAMATARRITLPLLKPVMTFVLIINTIRSFQVFIEVFVMTQGGPLGSTNTLVLYLYETAFRKLDYGYASAIAYVVFVLSAVFSLFAVRRMRSKPAAFSGG